jgi:hypothetical protein
MILHLKKEKAGVHVALARFSSHAKNDAQFGILWVWGEDGVSSSEGATERRAFCSASTQNCKSVNC